MSSDCDWALFVKLLKLLVIESNVPLIVSDTVVPISPNLSFTSFNPFSRTDWSGGEKSGDFGLNSGDFGLNSGDSGTYCIGSNDSFSSDLGDS